MRRSALPAEENRTGEGSMTLWQEGTPGVKRSGGQRWVKVSADGRGVVSHAGAALLRELATETGLAGGGSAALLGLLDPFAALVIGGRRVGEQRGAVISQRPDTSRAVGQQAHSLQVRAGPREPVASMPTAWRLLDRIDEPHLERLRAARRRCPPAGVGGRRGPGARR